jgi:hypothetical protein
MEQKHERHSGKKDGGNDSRDGESRGLCFFGNRSGGGEVKHGVLLKSFPWFTARRKR